MTKQYLKDEAYKAYSATYDPAFKAYETIKATAFETYSIEMDRIETLPDDDEIMVGGKRYRLVK